METYRTKAEDWKAQTRRKNRAVVLALPNGWRYVDGKVNARRDLNSQFASLYVPLDDRRTIMDINHTRVSRLARIHIATIKPSWLWVRHDATRSPNSRASRSRWERMVEPVDMPFAIDWSALA